MNPLYILWISSRKTLNVLVFLCFFLTGRISAVTAQKVLRVGVAGLSHDHVHNVMNQYKKGQVIIVGIAEGDEQLIQRYKKSYALPDSLFFPNLTALLHHTKPDIVLAYNAIAEHLKVVETCAPEGIPVMVEKPLATTVKDADRIAVLARQFHIAILTNYETTWYNSNQQIYELVNDKQELGEIRKMVVHDGHQGPKEIGCSPDFLSWLTDPVKNGGGALMDFGCYGANLMTWLMKGKAPIAVTAITRHYKPAVYPKVEDDATILLEYTGATGLIEASWNWPFGIKDLEVFGATGYLHALNGNAVQRRDKMTYDSVTVKPARYNDNIPYLEDFLSGRIKSGAQSGSNPDPQNDLSSLENNLIVVRILEAAKRSASEGKRIVL
ncbi:Gfo/Idh/MocA family protein [Flavitalea flava]